MPKNMGQVDRLVRIIVGLAIAAAYFMGLISGTLALILGVVAAVFVLTSLVGTCPAYMPLGLTTRRSK